jgi:hypothetical protein
VIVMIAALAIQSSGCATLHARRAAQRDAATAWPSTIAAARSFAIDGTFGRADSTLAKFAADYPGSPEALETKYWRALFKMDPTNAGGSLGAAIPVLDQYLAESRPREHLAEAMTLRRLASQLEALNRVASSAASQAREATSTAANAKAQVADANARADAAKADGTDAEIKRLKDELSKANAELERIRKRLSQPPPKP